MKLLLRKKGKGTKNPRSFKTVRNIKREPKNQFAFSRSGTPKQIGILRTGYGKSVIGRWQREAERQTEEREVNRRMLEIKSEQK